MKHSIIYSVILLLLAFVACGTDDYSTNDNNDDDFLVNQDTLKILSLGDSYTIGQSVCSSCRFPEQLKDSVTR